MKLLAALCLLVVATEAPTLDQQSGGYAPSGGFVPIAAVAEKIAEAVLVPVYGEKQIASERPFHATLKDDVWTVAGTLTCPDGKGGTTTMCVGGTAVVRLSKRDGRILSMNHYK